MIAEPVNTDNPLRAFIALPIPKAVTLFLQRVQTQLRSSAMPMRWVAIPNIHLTLKFLGDIDRLRIGPIAKLMDATAASMPSFSLRAKGVGVFPHRRRARVVWVGLTGDMHRLDQLQAGLDAGLVPIGFTKEARPFRAHLTIGRIRRQIDGRTVDDALEPLMDLASEPFQVGRLVLYKSVLTPAGAEYTLLHASPLASG